MLYDAIRLEIFKHQFASVAEEMGMVLQRTGFSPNIKERRDFSCALFDREEQMIAQAAHIPVHLGSMPLSVQAGIRKIKCEPGDMVILNDPYRGGTHLPDITLISPVYINHKLFGYVASRAHHSDVGGISPGSMPISHELFQEGVIIPPLKLVEAGKLNRGLMDLLLANIRTPEERVGDLRAQMAANRKGQQRLMELVDRYGKIEVVNYMQGLIDYAERMTRLMIAELPDGVYSFTDQMDDDGVESEPVRITVSITIEKDRATVDFTGSSLQCRGNINMVYAVTLSAVYYVFRCLVGLDVPTNSGCLKPLHIIAPEGTVVNATFPAAVAAGNVETSQRLVDVLLGALVQACPEKIPAASQGTMNNLAIGSRNKNQTFAYYETIGGGMGACPGKDGAAAIQTHMTNTMNTPIEALEYVYPILIRRYKIRRDSGGSGRWRGGDGICRDLELLEDTQVTILSDRRKFAPYGLEGGEPGQKGSNVLVRNGKEKQLPGKVALSVRRGDIISIRTPGGGGWGTPGSANNNK